MSLDRIAELLADEALQGLTPAQRAELQGLLDEWKIDGDSFGWAEAAAAVQLAVGGAEPEMPPELRRVIENDAPSHLPDEAIPVLAVTPEQQPRRWSQFLGWATAAAVLGVLIVREWPEAVPSLSEARAALLRDDPTALVARGEPLSGEGVSGDIVWSDREQSGYLRLSGLRPLESNQYQLWIIDGKRKHPVDGGVFEGGSGELIIPVAAKLRVERPEAFAITVEERGGVVVSDQEQVVWTASAN